jgi:hypothetical protein
MRLAGECSGAPSSNSSGLRLFLISSHLVSSHLVTSRLVSSRLVSSRLVSSRLVPSRLISSLLVSSPLPPSSPLLLFDSSSLPPIHTDGWSANSSRRVLGCGRRGAAGAAIFWKEECGVSGGRLAAPSSASNADARCCRTRWQPECSRN